MLRRIFSRNWQAKLGSLVVATILWFLIKYYIAGRGGSGNPRPEEYPPNSTLSQLGIPPLRKIDNT